MWFWNMIKTNSPFFTYVVTPVNSFPSLTKEDDRALKNSPVDYFSEGASWRIGISQTAGGLDGGFAY